jgi:hypothetical protein
VVDHETFWVDERSPVVYDLRGTQPPSTTLSTVRHVYKYVYITSN